jgi:hypothetical protein
MILSGIIWFLNWPIIILVSYQLIRFALSKYEKKLEEE